MRSLFPDHTTHTAPAGSRPILEATERKLGFLPAAAARMAESPALTAAFGRLVGQFDASSLAPVEREILALTVGLDVGCGVCIALHSATLTQIAPSLVDALREGRSLEDGRLEAFRAFVVEILRSRGAASDEALGAFVAAGYEPRHALDVVLGVGLYVMSTYANRLTRAPIDAPFEQFRHAGHGPEHGAAHA